MLAAEGTATGHLFAPHGQEDGSNLDTDVTGHWSLSGTTVTLSLDQDLLFNGLTLTAEPNQLRGNQTVTGNIAVEIVFTRTD
jgi:hypothetical protein